MDIANAFKLVTLIVSIHRELIENCVIMYKYVERGCADIVAVKCFAGVKLSHDLRVLFVFR